MQESYEDWLRRQGYNEHTINAQLYRAGRVEEYYGDFDEHFAVDRLESVIAAFAYTAEDARRNRPNPTLIPFKGAVRGNMNGYKFSVSLYRRYRDEPAKVGADAMEMSKTVQPSVGASKPGKGSNLKSKLQIAENPVTLAQFGFDGFAALEALIVESKYKSLLQAVASLTLFSHPDTVRQTFGKSVFRTIRGPRTPGVYSAEKNGKRVMLDDNKSASDAFKWANGLTGRFRDVQFNHIYTVSQDIDSYTSLANICVTPASIAKLTDRSSATTSALLKYRVFELYGWMPAGVEAPNMPEGYSELEWAPTLPSVTDVKAALESRMKRRPKDRTVLSVKEVGWLFGD